METQKFKKGQFCWTDLTVNNATELKDFYKKVLGWNESPIPMKDGEEEYSDYLMTIDEQTVGGGICNSRGKNSEIPPQWITYFYVEDVEQSLKQCLDLGGSLLKEYKKSDGSYVCVLVKDPQGIVFGIGNMS